MDKAGEALKALDGLSRADISDLNDKDLFRLRELCRHWEQLAQVEQETRREKQKREP
jgi:hypothetical protein